MSPSTGPPLFFLPLAWLGAVVLPTALLAARQRPPEERWLGVALFWGLSGLAYCGTSLVFVRTWSGADLEGATLGALQTGLALLVGAQRALWQPRGEGRDELRRQAWLAPAGAFLVLAATCGSLEALSWSELSELREQWEGWQRSSSLVVPPAAALAGTYAALWLLLAALWPGRRPAPPPEEETVEASGSFV